MSINEPTEPASTEGGLPTDDQVEVLVEDLFIEEYEAPLTLAPDHPAAKERKGRVARAVRPIRTRAKPLIAGLFALGGLALATLILRAYQQRKATRFSRLLHRLGMAR